MHLTHSVMTATNFLRIGLNTTSLDLRVLAVSSLPSLQKHSSEEGIVRYMVRRGCRAVQYLEVSFTVSHFYHVSFLGCLALM